MWYLMPVIPELGKLRQENCQEFMTSLGYIRTTQLRLQNLVFKKKKSAHLSELGNVSVS